MGRTTASAKELWRTQWLMHQFVMLVAFVGIGQHVLTGVHCEALGRGYKMTSISELVDGTGIVAHLDLIEGSPDVYGPDIDELRLTARYEEGGRIHVHIMDAKEQRWEVPESLIPRQVVSNLQTGVASTNPEVCKRLFESPIASAHPLLLNYTTEPFGFSISRRSNNEVLFNTIPEKDGSEKFTFNSLVFKDQYLEISSHLPDNNYLYGLGESTRTDGMRLTPGKTYTLWATDIGSYFVDIPLYSSYPLVLDLRKGGSAHGVLFLNSNGMDVQYEREHITFKAIGGVFDFYFFVGPSPLAVVDQYTQLVGRPAAMPYWTLGFHQARFGYRDVETLESVVEQYADAKLPLESMWADIDHMDNFKDFTLDSVNYSEAKLRPFVERLHRNDQKFIMILDPAIKIDDTYKPYVRGDALDVFLKNGTGEGRYISQVWPGAAYIPDFLHPNAESWWTQEIADFHEVIPFDGLWLDMNEPANFCSGPNCYYDPTVRCPDIIWMCCMICNNDNVTKWEDPPYMINTFGTKRALYIKTVTMSAQHYNGERMYDTHNIYGMTEALTTYRALKKVTQKRPFVLSRSCFIGSGSNAAHWTGDSASIWPELRGSIVSILSSGLFGVPMVGADICGFNMDATEELCRRWTQLGAFYPFARNHADSAAKSQEFYLWKSVTETASQVFYWRYRILPFLYTLLYESHTTGAPLARALFLVYPHDQETWVINDQFMLGDSLLVSPVLDVGTTLVHAYFPAGVWYSLFNHSETVHALGQGVWKDLPTPMDKINVHIRQGSIIPMQDFAMTTTLARKTPFTILVSFAPTPKSIMSCVGPSSILCEGGDRDYAAGHVYLDNDDQFDMTVTPGYASHIKFEAIRVGELYTLTSKVTESEYALKQGLILRDITVIGVHSPPQSVYINGRLMSVHVKMHENKSMDFLGLNHHLGENFDLVWTTTSSLCEADLHATSMM